MLKDRISKPDKSKSLCKSQKEFCKGKSRSAKLLAFFEVLSKQAGNLLGRTYQGSGEN